MTVIWRGDDVALWSDPALLDGPWSEGSYPAGAAQNLSYAIATGLGIGLDCVSALYEDPLDRLATEARLPTGSPIVPIGRTAPAEPDARLRLVAELDADRGDPVGWAIPLNWSEEAEGWTTTRWQTRRG